MSEDLLEKNNDTNNELKDEIRYRVGSSIGDSVAYSLFLEFVNDPVAACRRYKTVHSENHHSLKYILSSWNEVSRIEYLIDFYKVRVSDIPIRALTECVISIVNNDTYVPDIFFGQVLSSKKWAEENGLYNANKYADVYLRGADRDEVYNEILFAELDLAESIDEFDAIVELIKEQGLEIDEIEISKKRIDNALNLGLIDSVIAEKQKFTLDKEPWWHMELDYVNGAIEVALDYNTYFADFLRKEGYYGNSDDEVVDAYLTTYYKHYLQQEMVDD